MNALKIAAVGAEVAILGATASVAWGLVAGSDDAIRVVAPMIVAATAIEAVRLPLVLRAPKLGLVGAASAIVLALIVSTVTTETLLLGFEGLLTARAAKVAVAETRRAEAETALDAVKADVDERNREIERLSGAVAAAQRHSEEIGRESVALQANPSVSAYRSRRGWAAPGAAAANAAALSNSRAQADHARRASAAEADLAVSRAALAALKPIDPKAEEESLVAAQQTVERERAASPVHRLAASIFRVDVSRLSASDYETVRGAATISLALIVSIGTLAAGLISSLPDRKPAGSSKLAMALRRMIAARRKTLRRLQETVRVEVSERVKLVYVPCDPQTGKVLDPDVKP